MIKSANTLIVSIILLLLVPPVLVGCAARLLEPDDVVVAVPVNLLDGDEVDFEALLMWAEDNVRGRLPHAYDQGVVYIGDCEGLSNLRGKVVLIFGQTSPRLFEKRYLRATVTVFTESSRAEMALQDLTGRYPTTAPMRIPDVGEVKKAAAKARQHLLSQGISSCRVELAHLDDRWGVLCRDCICNFEVFDDRIYEKVKTDCTK
jgi:hypothetical protein